MKNTLFIADTGKAIKDTAESPVDMEMAEKLDAMLNEYGVQHFFSLPINATDGIANNPDDYVTVFYESENSVTFNLVYAVWCKCVRQIDDETIINALRKLRKE